MYIHTTDLFNYKRKFEITPKYCFLNYPPLFLWKWRILVPWVSSFPWYHDLAMTTRFSTSIGDFARGNPKGRTQIAWHNHSQENPPIGFLCESTYDGVGHYWDQWCLDEGQPGTGRYWGEYTPQIRGILNQT